MNGLEIKIAWQDPGNGIVTPELKATWARLEIVVDGHTITAVSDLVTKEVREALYLPVYPLAEWVAANWWSLCFEPRHSPKSQANPDWNDGQVGSYRSGYEARHSFATAREGYALPSLTIEAAGTVTELQWRRWRPGSARLVFLEGGHATLASNDVRTSLRAFVTEVIARLDSQDVGNTLLHADWAAIENASADEREFCELAGILGLDPYNLGQGVEDVLCRADADLPKEVLLDLAKAVRLPMLAGEVGRVKERLEQLSYTSALNLDAFGSFYQPPFDQHRPWMAGVTAARAVRDRLDLGVQPMSSISSISELLHLGMTNPDSSILASAGCREAISGVSTNDDGVRVGVIAHRPTSQRFAFCRGLYRAWSEPDASGALITHARTIEQKASRAFAAELLVPFSVIRSYSQEDSIDEDCLEDIASEYGVDSQVVRNQAENNNLEIVLA